MCVGRGRREVAAWPGSREVLQDNNKNTQKAAIHIRGIRGVVISTSSTCTQVLNLPPS